MDLVKISSRYQLVIPKEVRKSLGLKAGELIKIIIYEGRIELIPVNSINKLKGFVKGIDTNIDREEDRL
ncbi:MAG: AbrB/MazE/SpoVT family DNA-binding domain-containing protein [Brevinematales bacterium]